MTGQVRMIDVSSNNHVDGKQIDWRAVEAAGYGAVMVKCSEGVDYLNGWRQNDGHYAAIAGLRVGYYHFAHPGRNTAEAEAAYALAAIANLPRMLGLALDLEVTEGLSWPALAEWAQDFHARVRQVVDHSPYYLNQYFLTNLPGAPWGDRLWHPATARPRFEVWAWQETTPAHVPGVATLTDVGTLHPDW